MRSMTEGEDGVALHDEVHGFLPHPAPSRVLPLAGEDRSGPAQRRRQHRLPKSCAQVVGQPCSQAYCATDLVSCHTAAFDAP